MVWLPQALFLGIPEERFWQLNPRKMKPWKKAYEMRLEHEDRIAWETGRYFMASIGAALNGKPDIYPRLPFSQLKELQENPEDHDYQLDALKFRQYCKAVDDSFIDKTNCVPSVPP